ncbi:MAG: polyprenyl synthetase family protein, partial [Bryobacter sp.]|nr:polyprenyl synthetase family protein [Bryobacter sp.]
MSAVALSATRNPEAFWSDALARTEASLNHWVPAESVEPHTIHRAMRYSLFAGGKRIRPLLALAAAEAIHPAAPGVEHVGAALEMIHTYSLIHDDLPSMDDDDLRRGRETCHKKFGEATAILAGDALQALSFQAIAEDDRLSAETRLELITGLSGAAASMVKGQQADLKAEGKALSLADVEEIHAN